MPKLNSREKLLLGVLVTGTIALWVVLPGQFDRSRSGEGPETIEAHVGDPPVVSPYPPLSGTTAFDPDGRDLFKYYQPPRARPDRRTPPPKLPPAPTPSGSHVSRVVPVQPKLPAPSFKYIGYLGPKDDLIAVFNRGTDVFVAKIGEIVDGHYELVAFRHEAVILGYTEEAGQTTMLRKASG